MDDIIFDHIEALRVESEKRLDIELRSVRAALNANIITDDAAKAMALFFRKADKNRLDAILPLYSAMSLVDL